MVVPFSHFGSSRMTFGRLFLWRAHHIWQILCGSSLRPQFQAYRVPLPVLWLALLEPGKNVQLPITGLEGLCCTAEDADPGQTWGQDGEQCKTAAARCSLVQFSRKKIWPCLEFGGRHHRLTNQREVNVTVWSWVSDSLRNMLSK